MGVVARNRSKGTVPGGNFDDVDLGKKLSRSNRFRFGAGSNGLRQLMAATAVLVMLAVVLRERRTSTHRKLDFVVAGFPKAGTTTLMYAFQRHPQVGMDQRESSMIASVTRTQTHVYNVLQQDLEHISSSSGKLIGIKCPTALYGPQAIGRLAEWYPRVKWIIGLRHPILQMQSYYNYRITEGYDKYDGLPSWKQFVFGRPTFRSLLDIYFSDTAWKDISKFSHRYEFFLSQFLENIDHRPVWVDSEGDSLYRVYHRWKVQLRKLGQVSLAVPASRLFLYTTDQLEEPSFREALSSYLGLTVPLDELGHENINHFAPGRKNKPHAEALDLCDKQHDELRENLLRDATLTADWIIDKLLPYVTVSDRDSFVQSIAGWKKDPCSQ